MWKYGKRISHEALHWKGRNDGERFSIPQRE